MSDAIDLGALLAVLHAHGVRAGQLDEIVVTAHYRVAAPGSPGPAGVPPRPTKLDVQFTLWPDVLDELASGLPEPGAAGPHVADAPGMPAPDGDDGPRPAATSRTPRIRKAPAEPPPSQEHLAYLRLRDRLAAAGQPVSTRLPGDPEELGRRLTAAALLGPANEFGQQVPAGAVAWREALARDSGLVDRLGAPMAEAYAGIAFLAGHGEGLGLIDLAASTGRHWLRPYDCAADADAYLSELRMWCARIEQADDPWLRLQELRGLDWQLRVLVPAVFAPGDDGGWLDGSGRPGPLPPPGSVWHALLERSAEGLRAWAERGGFSTGIPQPGQDLSAAARDHHLGQRRLPVFIAGNRRDRVLWPVNSWIAEPGGRVVGSVCVTAPEHA